MAEMRECEALAFLQARMLFCIRMWVVEMRRGIGAEPRIEASLDEMGASAAASHLKAFMFALSEGSTRMIDVSCFCKRSIGADEVALLDVLAFAQEMRPFEALLLLRGFVTQDAAQIVLKQAEGVGNALVEAGLFLPTPDLEPREFKLSGAIETFWPAHATLH